jgi:hypothetical protein
MGPFRSYKYMPRHSHPLAQRLKTGASLVVVGYIFFGCIVGYIQNILGIF